MQTATNPQTGEKVQWNGSAWVPLGAGTTPQPAPAQQQGPITLGTPKPKKPEIRQVGDQLGLVDPDTGTFTPTYTKPQGAEGGESLTEGERKGGAFLKRGIGAYQQYEALGVGPRGVLNNVVNGVSPVLANKLPEMLGGNDPERQQASAAENEFLTAILRQDSGATITPEELESQRRIYFPLPGEDQTTVEAKRVARLRALEALLGAAGGGAAPESAAAVQQLLNPAPQNPGQTPDGTQIYDNSANAGQQSLSTGGTHSVADPRMEGVNAQVNQLIKEGAPNGVILKALKDRGADTKALMGVNQQLNEIRQFQKSNPGYRGDFNVDLERRDDQNSAYNDFAASPVATSALTLADTFTGGHVDNIVGMAGGDAEQANLGIQLSRETNPKAALVGDIAGGATAYLTGSAALRAAGVAPQAAGKVGAFAPRALAGDAALGGYVASGQGGTQIVDPVNTAIGTVTGLVAGAATRGTLNTAGRAISPTGGDLAPLYEAGVRPTMGQRLGAGGAAGRAVNRAEQAFASVPAIGSVQRSARNAAIDDMQRGAFNEALGEIGVQLPQGVKKGTVAHKFMQEAFDRTYDQARSGMQFAPDGQWTQDLSAMMHDVALLSGDSQNTFKQMTSLVGGKLRASGGVLSGDQYKLIVSRLGKKIGALRSNPSGDTELADALETLKTSIDDAARRQSNPDAVALLDKADAGYAKAVVIENAARMRGGSAGEFGGKQLQAGVQRTDKSRRSRAFLRGEATMQQYADAAGKLGDEVPDSGTTERLLTTGGLASLAHFIDPVALVPWAANTVANVPGARQVVGGLMAPRPQSIRGMTDKGRSLIELMARYGSPVAIPGTVSE